MSRRPDTEAVLTGRIVRRGDADYPLAAAGWNQLFSHRPRVIVFARDASDVVNALSWARQNSVAVRVRSGRHSLEGWSNVDDGLVIDVSELKSVSIDPVGRTATVGAGLTQLEAVIALGGAGFAAPTGTEGSVGLAGATLGGGFGLLTRAFGMACDNVVSVEVVTTTGADGAHLITVDEIQHPDLLWALRGAGNGNFGVVTSLTYSICELSSAVYVTATWPGLDDLREVFETWQRSAPIADERLTSQLEIHRDEILLVAVLTTGSEAEARNLLAPMLAHGHPTVTASEAGWADTYAGFQLPTSEEPANWMFVSQFIAEQLPAAALELIAAFMAKAPTAECNYFTNAFGGRVRTSEPAGGAAFAHRDALFYAEPGAGWGARNAAALDDVLTAECQEWVSAFGRAMEPFVAGAYVNVPNASMENWASAYWSAGVDRLRAIKASYDPDNVFSYEQSIVPEASSASSTSVEQSTRGS